MRASIKQRQAQGLRLESWESQHNGVNTLAELTKIERLSKGSGFTIAIDDGFCCYKFKLRFRNMGGYSIDSLQKVIYAAVKADCAARRRG